MAIVIGVELVHGCAGKVMGGGLMLCVVGAKLSEGINFSDGFGRSVLLLQHPAPGSGTSRHACVRHLTNACLTRACRVSQTSSDMQSSDMHL